jgi:ABC-2 type transport system permease protein
MEQQYSQLTAMMAIVKASFRAQLKSPSALVFGFAFPMFFILIFGSSNMQAPSSNIRFTKESDTTNALYQFIAKSDFFGSNIISNFETVKDSLIKGRITAIVDIQKNTRDTNTLYNVTLLPSKATDNNIDYLKMMFDATLFNINKNIPNLKGKDYARIEKKDAIGDRIYKRIDYVLPGQLGFSLLSAGLFGVAFLFFNLRETLVLKRLNATPIKRPYIILGEALARILFQMIIVSVIILLGKYLFGFTLVKGFVTFLELLLLSFIGLIVFMGFGFVISGAAKSINTVPVLTNVIGFPQFMLSGTFFPYKGLPSFLHPLCKILPLTHLNDALRKVAFEGQSLTSCGSEIGVLLIWVVVIYVIAFKIFKWE